MMTPMAVPFMLFLGGGLCVLFQRQYWFVRACVTLTWLGAGFIFLSLLRSHASAAPHWYSIFLSGSAAPETFSLEPFVLATFGCLSLITFLGTLYVFADTQLAKTAGAQQGFLLLSLGGAFLILFGNSVVTCCTGWAFVSVLAYLAPAACSRSRTPTLGLSHMLLRQHLFADMCVAFGLLIFALLRHSFTLSEIFNVDFWGPEQWVHLGADRHWYMFGGWLIAFGIAVKAAQNPFQNWLIQAAPVAMPLQAVLLHGVLAHSGLWLLLKMGCCYSLMAHCSVFFAIVGGVLMLFANLYANYKDNMKQLFAQSTAGTFGLVFFLYGLQLYDIAAAVLLLHMVFKMSLVFVGGAVVHIYSGEQSLSQMGGLRTRTPYTFYCAVAAAAGLVVSVVMADGGHYSEVLDLLYRSDHAVLIGAYCAALVLIGLTLLRWVALIFGGECRAEEHVEAHIAEIPWQMLWPLLGMTALSLLVAFLVLRGIVVFPELQMAYIALDHQIPFVGTLKIILYCLICMGACGLAITARRIGLTFRRRVRRYRRLLFLSLQVQAFFWRKIRPVTESYKKLWSLFAEARTARRGLTKRDLHTSLYWLDRFFPERLSQNFSALALWVLALVGLGALRFVWG